MNRSAPSQPRKTYGAFTLVQKLGSGSFGEVWKGYETNNPNNKAAIKLESSESKIPQLQFEYRLYKYLSGGNNIPRVYEYGTEKKKNYLAMQLLGKSLEDLFSEHGQLSEKTVLMLSIQMLAAVEYIHRMNYLHRDIKPDNFVMGLGENSNKIYVIDFGLSKKYYDPKKGHIPKVDGKSLTGTARYASVRALRGVEQSRRDDLESLGYVWLYLMRGSLPWMGLPCRNKDNKYAAILAKKQKTDIAKLCKGFSNKFVEYFEMVKALEFTEEPNYAALRSLLTQALLEKRGIYDSIFEWSRPRGYPKQLSSSRSNETADESSQAQQIPYQHRPGEMENSREQFRKTNREIFYDHEHQASDVEHKTYDEINHYSPLRKMQRPPDTTRSKHAAPGSTRHANPNQMSVRSPYRRDGPHTLVSDDAQRRRHNFERSTPNYRHNATNTLGGFPRGSKPSVSSSRFSSSKPSSGRRSTTSTNMTPRQNIQSRTPMTSGRLVVPPRNMRDSSARARPTMNSGLYGSARSSTKNATRSSVPKSSGKGATTLPAWMRMTPQSSKRKL